MIILPVLRPSVPKEITEEDEKVIVEKEQALNHDASLELSEIIMHF